mgnify:CR=1 FL=1
MIKKLYSSNWKYAKKWVYSVTFDEALVELHDYVVPICEKYGVPGHIEAVSFQMGQERNIGASSYNGYHHMSGAQMREMIKMGWGVGSHSHTHQVVAEHPEEELGLSKKLIEDVTGVPVTVFVAPGSNENLKEDVQKLLPQYGYLAGFGITDRINFSEEENMFFMGRIPLHERYWGTFDGYYDEFKRIHQAEKETGWIVDYCHCPYPKAIHDYKDCSAQHFDDRLRAVTEYGKRNVWLANPDRVVDYMYTRRYMNIVKDQVASYRDKEVYILKDQGLPKHVVDRTLTIVMETQDTPESIAVYYNGNPVTVFPHESGNLIFNITAQDNGVIIVDKRY